MVYAAAPGPGWAAPVLDVYAPAGAQELPLVVLLHGGSADKDLLDYPELAGAIAAGGAVVVVPNWGQPTLPWDRRAQGETTDQILDDMRRSRDEVACAVSYSVTHAAEYGADPARLVLFGHSAGATPASVAALTESFAFAGCAVPPADWTVQGLMLWEGDLLASNPQWHVFGTDLAAILPLVGPWPSLDTAHDVPSVEFAVSTTARSVLRTPDASPTAEWLAWRDPTGRMQDQLQAIDAFADGYLDVGEVAEVLVEAMIARGRNASLLELTDPATTHTSLADADLDLIVEHVLALTAT